MFHIALRNIFRHKARSLVSLSTIAFGCVALMFVAGFFADALSQMKESYINAQLGHIQVFKKGYAQHSKISPYSYLIKDTKAIEDLIHTVPEVKSVGARLEFSALINLGEASLPCMVQGVDSDFDKTFLSSKYKSKSLKDMDPEDSGLGEIIAGESLNKADPAGTVLLGKGLAEALNTTPGTYVTLLTNTVQGGINALDMTIKGIMATADKNYDDIFVRIPITTAQELLNTQSVQNIVVKVHHTEDTDKVKQKLAQLFATNQLDLEMKTWDDLSDFYVKTAGLFNMFNWVMRIVIAIAVILGIFNTMNMAVMERFSEIGTIMALGVKRRGVLILFLYEGLLLGAIGGIAGLLLGCLIISGIAYVGIVMPPSPGTTISWVSEPALVGSVMVFTFILSVIIGGVSSWFPACRASHLKIVEALRYR